MVDVVQEEEGVLKSGLVYGGLSPLKSKKSFYCVLRERVIELHESEKSQKKNKTPKLIIDLAICFNVNRKVDTKLKECVSIMMPDECYVLRGETDEQTEDWYDAFISAAIPARALHLGRPVSRDEFFECAWEVTLMKYPKLKKAPPRADLEDLCAKNPKLLGDKRLCFYPHAVVICERGIEPATTGIPTSCIPPFKKEDFIEVQLMYVANFGKQEKYFFMRMGRSAPTGSGEIWAMAESGEVATDMHNKLNKIVERESEKKRQLGVGPLVHPRTTSSSRHPGSSGSSHRERSNTQPQRQRTPSIDNIDEPLMGAPSPLTKFLETCERDGSLQQRRYLRGYKARVDSFEEEQDMLSAASSGSTTFLSADVVACSLPNAVSRSRLGGSPAPISVGSLPAQRKTSEQAYPAGYVTAPSVTRPSPFAWTPPTSTQNVNRPSGTGAQSPQSVPSTANSSSGAKRQLEMMMSPPIQEESMGDYTAMQAESTRSEETEDSGGTLRLDAADSASGTPIQKMAPRSPLSSDGDGRLPDYVTMGEQHPLPHDHKPGDYTEMGLPDDATARWIESASTSTEYTPMDASTPPIASSSSGGSASHLAVPSNQSWHLEEVRSYVSDSSDSCYSSMGGGHLTGGQPRAYSFGSRGPRGTGGPIHLSNGRRGDVSPVLRSATTGSSSSAVANHHLDDSARANPPTANEDHRKRAYSLGNKSWFRKLSQMSIIGRYGDSFTGEASEMRGRSDSFGSGRSTPFSRKEPGVRSSVSASHDRDLVELDFGGPLGRSPSGSLASCESPSRSRTSSFGGAARGEEHHGHRGPSPHTATPARALISPSEKPSDALIADYLRNPSQPDYLRNPLQADYLRNRVLVEEVTPPSNVDSSDYVLAEAAPRTTVVHAVVEAPPRFIQPNSIPFESGDYEMMHSVDADKPSAPAAHVSHAAHYSNDNVHIRQQSSSIAPSQPQLSVRTSGMFETIVEASSGKSSRKSSTSSLTPMTPVMPLSTQLSVDRKDSKPTTPKHSPIVRLLTTLTSPKSDRKKNPSGGESGGAAAVGGDDDDYAQMEVGKAELVVPASLPKRGSVPLLQCQTSVPEALIAARTQPNSPAVAAAAEDGLDYAYLQLTPPVVPGSVSFPTTPIPHKEYDSDATDYAVVDAAKCQIARKHERGQLSPR